VEAETGRPEPTPRELEILKILWDQGRSSVRDVYRQLLAREPDLAYNTVQTLLRLMEGKGLVRHEEEGRSFIYAACHSRDETRDDSTVRFLDRVFDGAAEQLVESLLRRERITGEELDRLEALIAQARRGGSRGGLPPLDDARSDASGAGGGP
jgi:predicted transcriptional regulator